MENCPKVLCLVPNFGWQSGCLSSKQEGSGFDPRSSMSLCEFAGSLRVLRLPCALGVRSFFYPNGSLPGFINKTSHLSRDGLRQQHRHPVRSCSQEDLSSIMETEKSLKAMGLNN